MNERTNERTNERRIEDVEKINAYTHELIAKENNEMHDREREREREKNNESKNKNIYTKPICITLKTNDRTRQWQRSNFEIGYSNRYTKQKMP